MTRQPILNLVALAAAATVASFATPAHAQAPTAGETYIGFGVGQARHRLNEDGQAASVLGASGPRVTSIERNQRDTGYKVFLGQQLTTNLGLELGFYKLGTSRFTATTVPTGVLRGLTKVQGANLDLVGQLPVTDKFSVLGRVGAAWSRTRAEYAGTAAAVVSNPDPSRRKTNPKIGLGLQYAFSPGVVMRGELERYRVNDAVGANGRVNMVSVGFVFPFGGGSAPARRSMATEPVRQTVYEPTVVAPVAPVAQAAPRVAPMPIAVERQKVAYSAESMFGFDQATMTAEGKAALDSFAKELEGTRFDLIVVEGYTDRLGTATYNQALSLERAEAVKSYLVSSGRVDPARISTVGNSQADPVTTLADCPGKEKTAKLILCLQPDRRVEIGVSGTR